VLIHVLSLAMLGVTRAILTTTTARSPMFGTGYMAYQILIHTVFGGFGGLLLAASIACLRRREWGRVWLIRYAIAYPIALVLEVGGSIVLMIPTMTKMMATATKNPAASPMPPSVLAGIMVGTQVLMLVVLLILPVCILVFLRKREVRAVFA